MIENRRRHYNAVRPHGSLNYLTPYEFKQQHPPSPNRAVFQELLARKSRGQARKHAISGRVSAIVKIIVTGVAGTGKSTLASFLVAQGLVDELVAEDYSWLGRSDLRTEEGRREALKRSVDWYNSRAQKCISSTASFVMDRGPMDILHLWLTWRLAPFRKWEELFAKTQKAISPVDLIVLAPFEGRVIQVADRQPNEIGLARVVEPFHDARNQAILIGLCLQLTSPERILLLPRSPTSTPERASLIAQKLRLP